MRNVIFAAVAITLASLMMVPSPDAFEPEQGKHRLTKKTKKLSQRGGGGDVVLQRSGGHFFTEVDVNGTSIKMLADTGASAVVLSVEDAEAAGINVDALNFSATASTANGESAVAPVTLDEVRIGSISRSNVRAFVTRDMNGSLLGMSFFNTLSKVAIESNEMVLED